MANKTLVQYPTGLQNYKITFDYLARPFVKVTLVNSEDKTKNKELKVGSDYKFINSTTIEILTSTSDFDIVQLHRYTQVDLVVDFRDGSVLTAKDLTNAELQAIHIAEEGRDQTVDLAKEYSEIAVDAGKEAKDILKDIIEMGKNGYNPVGSFEDGGTVINRNDVLQFGVGTVVTHWRWEGEMPKIVPENSSPTTAGGIGSGKWVDVTDATLRGQLSKPDGVKLVGGATRKDEITSSNGSKLVGLNDYETLFSRLNQVFNAAAYGLSSSNTAEDNTKALQRLSKAVTDSGGGVIFIPTGEYIVGVQHRNKPADHDPDVVRAYGVESNLSLQNLTKDLIIISYGASFKLANGLRFGAFNPETGEPRPYSPTSNDMATRADTGFIFNIVENPKSNIVIKGVHMDGNMSNLILGGQWGDVGRQCDGYGMRIRNYKSLYIENVTLDKLPLDGLYTGDGWYANKFKEPKPTLLNKVIIKGCGRDNWSITGNGHYHAVGCLITLAGMFEVSSNPASGVNIETEAGKVYQVVFDNCVLSNCRDANLLTTSRSVYGVKVNNSLVYHDEEYFDKGTVAGIWMRGSTVDLFQTTLRNSRILNQIGGKGSTNASTNTPLAKNCLITNVNIDGTIPTKFIALLNSDKNHMYIDECVVEVVNPTTGKYHLQLDGVTIDNTKVFIKGRVIEDKDYSGILGYIRNSKFTNSYLYAFNKDGSKRFGFDFSGTYDLTNTLFLTNRINMPTPSIFKHGNVFVAVKSDAALPSTITVYQGQKITFLDGVEKTVKVSGCNSDYSHSGVVENGRFEGMTGNPFKVGDIITVNGSVVGFVIDSGSNWVETTTGVTMSNAVIRYQKPTIS